MPAATQRAVRAPALIRLSNPLTSRLLRLGLRLGPNVPMTVVGRRSGKPRTAVVAVVEVGDRRWVASPYGEVHWVHNLRESGEATLLVRGRPVAVRAVELDPVEASRFFGEVLTGYLAGLPRAWRTLTRLLMRVAAPEVLDDPAAAARRIPVFELIGR